MSPQTTAAFYRTSPTCSERRRGESVPKKSLELYGLKKDQNLEQGGVDSGRTHGN